MKIISGSALGLVGYHWEHRAPHATVRMPIGNLTTQSASTPRAVSEATGKLPCGLGQPATPPSVLRRGQTQNVRITGALLETIRTALADLPGPQDSQ